MLFNSLPTQRRPLKPVYGITSPWRPPASLPSLKGAKRIAVDTETCDPHLDEIGPGDMRGDAFVAGISLKIDGGPKMYLPIRHEGGDNLDPDMINRYLRYEFGNYEGEVHGARILYDLQMLATDDIYFHKVKPENFYDPQVAEVLIDEWRYSYGLDSLLKDRLGVGKEMGMLNDIAHQFKWKTDRQIKQNLWKLPGRYVGPYAEGDVEHLFDLIDQQKKIITEQELDTVFTIERSLTPVLLGMRRRGVRIDTKRAEMIGIDLQQRIDDQVKILRSFAGPRAELNEVATWVQALKDTGLKLAYTEPTEAHPQGQISTAKPWLEKNQHHPMIAAIMLARKYYTAKNTFVDGHLSRWLINGRVHCTYNQLKNEDGKGTAARLASEDPNMQNVPARDEEMAELIRRAFLPDEDEWWQRDDYSQIEYRLGAHFAVGRGSDDVRKKYNDDPKTDYHKLCAIMLNVDPEDKVKRKRVKNTNFAKGYGAQVPKLAITFNCSIEEAQKFVDEYEAALPFTVDSFNAAEKWAAKHGMVRSVLGRRARFDKWVKRGLRGKARHLPDNAPLPHEDAIDKWGQMIERADTYKAWNNKLQFSSADITKKAMVDAHAAGIYRPTALGFPLVSVHDEAGSSVKKNQESDEAGRELTRIMERAVKLRVPVLVESERGASWGDCK